MSRGVEVAGGLQRLGRPTAVGWWVVTGDDLAGPGHTDFIREIIEDDLRTGKHDGRVVTRFPPSRTAICTSVMPRRSASTSVSPKQYGGHCNLRFDDTNPLTEGVEYVDSIIRDIKWLGFSFGEQALFASDYFEEMYQLAEQLIVDGRAYVDHLSDEEIREYRGSLGEPGRPSPYRSRNREENLALFREMRAGGLPDGTCVLRAKIDVGAANMKMRDPLLYRIRHVPHHRTGDAWPIYPMYDWAHPISDAIEGVTHSLCTLEFENNRELYDWVIDSTGVSERHGFSRPQQYEFARLNLDYTVMSKRKLLALVDEGAVAGMGRSADAHHRGHAPARHQPGSDPRLCRSGRRRQGQLDRRPRKAGVLRPGRSQLDGSPRHGRASASRCHHHVLARRRGRATDRALLSAGHRQAGRADHTLRTAHPHRSGRLHAGPATRLSAPGPRPDGPPALRPLHHL